MIPLAVVLTTLFNLGLNLVVVLIFILAWGIAPDWTWLLLPAVVVALFGLTMAVSMIVSSLYPRFRDMAILWGVAGHRAVLRHARCSTRLEVVPGTLRDVIQVNPLSPLFELARLWIIDPTAPGPVVAAGGGCSCCPPPPCTWVTCVLAVWVFRREAPRIAEQL